MVTSQGDAVTAALPRPGTTTRVSARDAAADATATRVMRVPVHVPSTRPAAPPTAPTTRVPRVPGHRPSPRPAAPPTAPTTRVPRVAPVPPAPAPPAEAEPETAVVPVPVPAEASEPATTVVRIPAPAVESEPATAVVAVAAPAASAEPATAVVPVDCEPATAVVAVSAPAVESEPVTAVVPVDCEPATAVVAVRAPAVEPEPATALVPVESEPTAAVVKVDVEPVTAVVAVPAPAVAPEPTTVVAAPAPAGTDPVATAMAELLAGVLEVDEVDVDKHVFDDLGADSMIMARFCARARKRDDVPSVSMKDVYRHPTIRGLATAPAPAAEPSVAAPTTAEPTGAPFAGAFAEVLADVLGVEQVAVDAHFFDDLGADSMVMARFCAKVRKRDDLPSVSIKNVYAHPTVGELAAAFAPPSVEAAAPAAPVPAPVAVPTPDPTHATAAVPPLAAEAEPPTGTSRYVLCGALQLLIFLAYTAVLSVVFVRGVEWIVGAVTVTDVYLRSVAYTTATFVALCALPIVTKWVLVGRWRPRQFRVWSMTYLRFWVVKILIRSNPLAAFVGSPIYAVYLRALGAKIGRDVTILTGPVPACPDLLTVGDNTIVRKESLISCYRAHDGVIQTGAVTLGRDVFVGEKTVLDIGTSMGDGAQLGHTSSLHSGQAVPAGEHWHGSPAERTDVDYRTVAPARRSVLRRTVFTAVQLVSLLVFLPLPLALVRVLYLEFPVMARLLDSGTAALQSANFYLEVLVVSTVLFVVAIVIGFAVVVTVPRLLNLFLKPDRVYRLYGFHYLVHRVIAAMTNQKFFTQLFGDSSYVVGYLRSIGYQLTPVVQTGSNFGMAVQHENPFLSSVGGGTVVADGLSFLNADYSSTSFRVSRVAIGGNNFLGNHVAYPAQGRTGDNCLLGTKVLVPIEGEIREGVGLLGSPSFEIPRTVARDSNLDVADAAQLRRKLAAKNRHNAVTILLRLLSRWGHLFVLTLLMLSAINHHQEWGAFAFLPVMFVGLLFTVVYFVLVERAVDHLQALAPQGCSIYDRAFWRHERAWKLPSEAFYKAFDGTPFKNVVWRMLGVRIGRRVFDDGCALTERSFATIGDHCTLNAGATVQCHSQEDGAFKSDRTVLGAGCTLGVGAFVHYGVTMGDGATLAPDSFLMKGEEIAPRGRWGGNPAVEIYDTVDDLRDVLALDRARPVRTPEVARRGRTLGRLPVAAAATGLGALIVLALTGGTAVAMGVPVPFGVSRTPAVPAAVTSTPTPSSSAPAAPVATTTTPPAPTTTSARATAKRPAAARTTAPVAAVPKTTTPRAKAATTTTKPPKTTATTTKTTKTTTRAASTTTRPTSSTSTPTETTTDSTSTSTSSDDAGTEVGT